MPSRVTLFACLHDGQECKSVSALTAGAAGRLSNPLVFIES